jgi:2-oxoglutarate dehydrogenase E2 component (dihydrolipoamide succinyltransferase)
MARMELVMPKMGESITEATIIKWHKSIGDRVEVDETILEIATDKVDSEIPSPFSGTLIELRYSEEDVVDVGTVIAIIASEDAINSPIIAAEREETKPIGTDKDEVKEEIQVSPAPVIKTQISTSKPSERPANARFYSPLVRSIATQEGLTEAELAEIPGTGAEGRVNKQDILSYLDRRKANWIEHGDTGNTLAAIKQEAFSDARSTIEKPSGTSLTGDDEIIEMDRMRRIIADHMVMSKRTSPHVTSFIETDVTTIVQWREKIRGDFEKSTGDKITYTPIFIEAVAKAIKDFPRINVSVNEHQIIIHKHINIGMATALPSGNLIVPVIHNTDHFNLRGIVKKVNDLSARARASKLSPEEVKSGTFTITNVGTFGNTMGTPIINQPQVAILSVGAIKKKPAVIETPEGDVIAIRQMMFLSLSYDHRVVDGMLGGSFLRRVADYLEQFDPNTVI